MKASPFESGLIGHWVVIDRQMKADDTCKRIDWLIENHPEKIGSSEESGGWSTLFPGSPRWTILGKNISR